MAQSAISLLGLQNRSRRRAFLDHSAKMTPEGTAIKRKKRGPHMMRQYELIERVKRYNPNTNEALLNRAYVYAMKAHGSQRRASGDPYFSHPIEVAAILTDLKL